MENPQQGMVRVSVLMVAHNAGGFLLPAVESVLGQTLSDFELVLVDNASTDGSMAALVQRVDDPRLRVVAMAENLGAVGGQREGLLHCRGDWLALMDADDVSLPHRLEAQLAFLKAHPEWDVLTTFAEEIDAEGRPLGFSFSLYEEEDIRAYAEFDMPVRLNTAMMRRDFAQRIGFGPLCSWAGDYEFLLRALEVGRVACLPEVLHLYRVHERSMTGSGLNRQAYSAGLARFRAVCRRRGESPGASDAEEDGNACVPDLRSVHRLFMRRALEARLPALAIFHARRARSVSGLLRGLLGGCVWEPGRLAFLGHLALCGPVRALRVKSPRHGRGKKKGKS